MPTLVGKLKVKYQDQGFQIIHPETEAAQVRGLDTAVKNAMPIESRMDSTEYAVGDIVFDVDLPSWAYLDCAAAGVTASTKPAGISSSATKGATITDGSVTWTVRRLGSSSGGGGSVISLGSTGFIEDMPFTAPGRSVIATPNWMSFYVGSENVSISTRQLLDLSDDDVWDTQASLWQASHEYALDDIIYPNAVKTGYYYRCVVAGTSSAAQGTFNTTLGGTTEDGTVTWECEIDPTVGSNRAGKDFYIYCVNKAGDYVFLLSENSISPEGYSSATEFTKVGGFHCLCADIGTATYGGATHKLYGYMAGDVLPYSIWDQYHRPFGDPEGMSYVPGINLWVSIYGLSWEGTYTAGNDTLKLVSKYNGVWADGTSAEKFHAIKFDQILGRQGQRLLFQNEFIQASLGSNQGTAIKGAADPNTTGGHVDTSNIRMVSWWGHEDMCGALWQWAMEVGGNSTSGWAADTLNDVYAKGQDYYGHCRGLFGGDWGHSSYCGSRCSNWSNPAWNLNVNVGGRAAGVPLNPGAGLKLLALS